MRFVKYQATGNDFILIDNRTGWFEKSNQGLIAKMCHRRWGIGADGLMLLEQADGIDFKMVYFNADGRIGSMCGNGGRCISAFAFELMDLPDFVRFSAYDGLHNAKIFRQSENHFLVSLSMNPVREVTPSGEDWILNTGSPHYVKIVDNVELINVPQEGRRIRNSAAFSKEGINVNFVQVINNAHIAVRTFERGVEDETYSCGTGVTAAALAIYTAGLSDCSSIEVQSQGGPLKVYFKPEETHGHFNDILLEGPAVKVFEGEMI
ncbi:MAG: diaminopimelate epimerase [Bacteroidia bacterium]|nr:diaminopimelate epimerase [Bacteroidia bacterium]MCC6769213.1 diaminopimelate epimerase [Bacteroidia bacterium]